MRSKRRSARRNRRAESGQSTECPPASRYQLAQPPLSHTVPRARRRTRGHERRLGRRARLERRDAAARPSREARRGRSRSGSRSSAAPRCGRGRCAGPSSMKRFGKPAIVVPLVAPAGSRSSARRACDRRARGCDATPASRSRESRWRRRSRPPGARRRRPARTNAGASSVTACGTSVTLGRVQRRVVAVGDQDPLAAEPVGRPQRLAHARVGDLALEVARARAARRARRAQGGGSRARSPRARQAIALSHGPLRERRARGRARARARGSGDRGAAGSTAACADRR